MNAGGSCFLCPSALGRGRPGHRRFATRPAPGAVRGGRRRPEAADGLVALRLRDGRALDPKDAAGALRLICAVVAERGRDLVPAG